MAEEISRRRFLQGIGAGALAALCGCVDCPKIKNGNSVNPYNLVRIFYYHGVDPVMHYNCGERLLIQIVEEHLGYGDEYVKFFENLEGRIDFDMIFMENVYANHHEPDPCTALHKDNAEIAGKEFSAEDFMQKDPSGYFRLSSKYRVHGIEDNDRDAQILWTMFETSFFGLYPLTGEYSNGKDPLGEARMNAFVSNLKKARFAPRTYPERDYEAEIRRLREEIKTELAKAIYPARNKYFAEVIDKNLGKYQAGALIIGRGHTFPTHTDGAEILEPYFKKRQINTILLDIEQVKEFNRKKALCS